MANGGFELVVCDDAQAVAEEAAARWLTLAREAVRQRGRFVVALSGGSSPRPLYRCLAQPPYLADVPWRDTHVFWSDERTVPPDDERSNYRLADDELLSRVPVPPGQIHRPRGEDKPVAAAATYDRRIRDVFGVPPKEVPRFDLILLGLGEDGHTASLFPGTTALREHKRLFVANPVPQLDTVRLTMTHRLINAAACVVFLVVGADKAPILHVVLEGPPQLARLPAQSIRPADGTLVWLVDRAAASHLAT